MTLSLLIGMMVSSWQSGVVGLKLTTRDDDVSEREPLEDLLRRLRNDDAAARLGKIDTDPHVANLWWTGQMYSDEEVEEKLKQFRKHRQTALKLPEFSEAVKSTKLSERGMEREFLRSELHYPFMTP